MQETSSQFVSKNLLAFLQEELDKAVREPFEIKPVESDLQSLQFYYPTLEPQNSYVAQSVYIECGIRGCMEPSEVAQIKPYSSEIFNSEPVQVQVLSPLRTFWEKATLLHAEFNRPADKTTPLRLSRHFYDLYMFSQSPYLEKALDKTELLKNVILHKTLLFPSSWSNYTAILDTGIQLTPPDIRLSDIQADYEQTKIMLFRSIPEFPIILEKIRGMEGKINDALFSE